MIIDFGLFEHAVDREIMTCFRSIHYHRVQGGEAADRLLWLCGEICRDTNDILGLLREKLLPLVEAEANRALVMPGGGHHWVVGLAMDRESLELNNFSLAGALMSHVMDSVRGPLSKALYFLESCSALEAYLCAGGG